MTLLSRLTTLTSKRPLIVLIAAALAGCGRSEVPESTEAPAAAPTSEVSLSAEQIAHGGVKWAPATVSTVTETVELPGELKVDEDRTVRVSAPAPGRLLAIRANVGDRVTSGQVVASLQSEEGSAARANLAKATAELGSHRAALDYARTARERAERLLALKAISQQDVERARTDEKAASAMLAQAEAEVERATAALARLDVDPATGHILLKSTLGGIVLNRDAVAGAVVDAGATILIVTNPDSLWLQVAVPDRLVAGINPGSGLRFTVSAFPAETFEARVHRLAGTVDPATRTVLVRANVPNRQRRLRPEMLATVRLESGQPQKGVVVPDDAVQLLDGRSVLFIAEPDGRGGAVFKRREIELVARGQDQRQVVRGVKEGELVVTEGAFAVKAQFGRSRIQIG
ncbi:MAG TPA: efflux RND transporter periplasmic adaptor subunit [Vicinamibacterales bacterium]|nr:efflux RND transporter periplasmic adaptor subunit [Vicinamibacterales bacterium]